MSIENAYSNLIKCIPKEKILKNEIMSKHTSFKVGGSCRSIYNSRNNRTIKRYN